MKKQTSMLAILCAAAATAALGDYSWNVTTGGALDAAANWTPQGTPGSSDAVTLRYAQSAPCSLAGTGLSVKTINVQNNVDIDMDAVRSRFAFSLPEGCTLDLSNPREIAVNVPSRRGTVFSFK